MPARHCQRATGLARIGRLSPEMTAPPGAFCSRGRATRRCAVASRRAAQRGSSRTVFREGNRCGPGDQTHRRWLTTPAPAPLFQPAPELLRALGRMGWLGPPSASTGRAQGWCNVMAGPLVLLEQHQRASHDAVPARPRSSESARPPGGVRRSDNSKKRERVRACPWLAGAKRGRLGQELAAALAAEAAAEVMRLAAAAAASLAAAGQGLEAAEKAIRAGLIRLGASVLEDLLAADGGYAGPRLDCGCGH